MRVMHPPRCAHGFTLIELVVSLAIVGILVMGLLPLAQLANQRAKEQELRSALREIRNAIDAYKKASDEGRIEKKADMSGYPPSLSALEEGVKDAKKPDGKKIYFIRRVPRDPFFDQADASATQTWGLRSYESGPEDPRRGDDVFDVHSTSPRTGLNGVPYRKW
ncbi:MAG TPA: type II secretion system protein [Burkholderiales bacterium]|nr:type II secretion system protein [Burkholderiales bacterium]